MSETPYLIQRGKLKRGYSASNRLGLAVGWDYMGSSEFEYGALNRALKALRASPNRHALVLSEILDHQGRPLRTYGLVPPADAEVYQAQLQAVIERRERTMEATRFQDQIAPEPIQPPRRYRTKAQKADYIASMEALRTNLWWDLDNNVFLSFEAEFMDALPSILEATWAFMDAQASAA